MDVVPVRPQCPPVPEIVVKYFGVVVKPQALVSMSVTMYP